MKIIHFVEKRNRKEKINKKLLVFPHSSHYVKKMKKLKREIKMKKLCLITIKK